MTIPPSYSFPPSHAQSSTLWRRRFSHTDALQALHRDKYLPAARGGSRGRGRGGAASHYARSHLNAYMPTSPGEIHLHHWPVKKSNVWITPALASSKTQVAAAARAEAPPLRGGFQERMRLGHDGVNKRSSEHTSQSHQEEVGVKRARLVTATPFPHSSTATAPASASLLPLWEREMETRQEASCVHARRGEKEKWIRNRDALEWLRARVAVAREDAQRQRRKDMGEAGRRAGEEHDKQSQTVRGGGSENGESSGGSGDVFDDEREEGEWEEIEISDTMRKERDGHPHKEDEYAEEVLYMHGDAASDVEDLLDYGFGLEKSY